jgi:hypothetical protein
MQIIEQLKPIFRPLLKPLVLVPLIFALFVSAQMFVIGLFYPFSLSGEHRVNSPTYFVSLSMIAVMPIFLLLLFISRRILSIAMWLLVIANYCGEYVRFVAGYEDGHHTYSVLKIAIDIFSTPPASLSIMIAILVELAYRMERRRMSGARAGGAGGQVARS